MVDKRVPPHDLTAEESVLGSILIDTEAIIKIGDTLRADSFYDSANSSIYEAMEKLYEDRKPIDAVTLTDQLKKMKKLKQVGGSSRIAELSNLVSTAANIENYAQLIVEAAVKRRIITLSGELSAQAFDPSVETTELMDLAEQKIFKVSQTRSDKAFTPLKDTLVESFERLDELQRSGDDLRGVPTGFVDLDRVLAGLQRSNLIVLAARPGMGKTALALNIAQYAAVSAKRKVGFFSLEMSKEELVDRLLVSQADIDAWRLKTGRLDQQDFLKLSDAMGVLADAPIFIDDTPGMSVYEMRTKARRLMAEQKVDLIVMDYLQLAHGQTRDNRVQEVGEISQGLKNIARELKIPVIALSQLNRAVESRGEKSPQLSDLRESGCLVGESRVYLPGVGERVQIKDLVGKKDFSILALDPETYQLKTAQVTNAFCTGTKKVFKLTTALGREIKATSNHKFLTISGWKRLDELKIDEHLALPRNLGGDLRVKKSQQMSAAELSLLAHLIGDGCILPRHAIQYTSKLKELAETVAALADEVFGDKITTKIKKERTWYQLYLKSTRPVARGVYSPIKVWLENLGLWGQRSHQKFVPELVFKQNLDKIALFLRHLWVTDGCIALSKMGKKHYPRVYYASSSQRLAQDVQTLLLRLGINARLKRVSQKNKGRDQFHIILSGNESLSKFAELVGTVGVNHEQKLGKVKEYLVQHPANTNRDVIPSETWRQVVVPAMTKLEMSSREMQKGLGMSYCGTSLYKSNLSRERALRVAEVTKSQQMMDLAQSDVYWDKITSVDMVGEEKVYDLTVPGPSNFIAENIIAHNSIEQDSDVVMFLYREDDDLREAVKLKIAKHRNGALGTIDLFFRGDRIKFFDMENKPR
jgi:replicative DNA helicase